MKYLADSDYLVDALIGRPAAIGTLDLLSGQGVAVSIISFGEIFEGAFRVPDPRELLARFRSFLAQFRVILLSDPIMERFARLRSTLRRNGLLIPDMDLLIAATALEHNLEIVTRNRRHFDRIPELVIYQPTSSRSD